MEKLVTGIGVLLRTDHGTFLFQERDKNIKRNPGVITPFGGGINKSETPIECAIRELNEELELRVNIKDLKEIGIFQSHFSPGTYIQIYLVEGVDLSDVTLHEGKNVKEMSTEETLRHPQVTNFTKEVIATLKTISQ